MDPEVRAYSFMGADLDDRAELVLVAESIVDVPIGVETDMGANSNDRAKQILIAKSVMDVLVGTKIYIRAYLDVTTKLVIVVDGGFGSLNQNG